MLQRSAIFISSAEISFICMHPIEMQLKFQQFISPFIVAFKVNAVLVFIYEEW